jgi:hypothetical protein
MCSDLRMTLCALTVGGVEIRRLFAKGISKREIAKRLKIGGASVRRVLTHKDPLHYHGASGPRRFEFASVSAFMSPRRARLSP